jgi:hypothetical protein
METVHYPQNCEHRQTNDTSHSFALDSLHYNIGFMNIYTYLKLYIDK